MEIKQYIYDLLFTQDCVILPKLGAFITKSESAVIDEKTKTITPPRKRVVFDDTLTTSNENLIAKTIAESEGIGIELALLEVEVFISDIQSRLLGGETVSLEGIGSLVLGQKGKINFAEEENSNFHPDAFGLSTIKYVNNNTAANAAKLAAVVPEKKATKRRSWKWLVWLLVIAVVGGLGFSAYKAGYVQYAKDFIAKHTKDQAPDTLGLNDNPSEIEENLAKSLKEEPVVTKTDSLPKIEEAKKEVTTDLDKKETKKEPEKEQPKKVVKEEVADAKFFIIESSYGDSINALKRSNDLKAKGYNSQVMPKENSSFRVSMGAFTNRSTAVIELERIKSKEPKLKVWIYKK